MTGVTRSSDTAARVYMGTKLASWFITCPGPRGYVNIVHYCKREL